jgi:hypothetical protein
MAEALTRVALDLWAVVSGVPLLPTVKADDLLVLAGGLLAVPEVLSVLEAPAFSTF